jgi:spermidine synthase
MHRAAFVLPDFGRALLEGKAILPELEKKAEGKKRKVLMLGSGYVSRPAAEYILRDPRNELTIGEWLVRLLAINLTTVKSLPYACSP